MKSSMQGGAQAPKLSAPAQSIAAMLTSEHASEDAELVEGQRLAARFVRRPGDEACASAKRSVMPYVVAGVFALLAAGGAAAYFVTSDGAGQGGNGYVSASFATPYGVGPGARQPQAVPGQGAKSASWNEAVETFRALANSGEEPDKAAEPKLEQLATGFSTATEGK